MSPLMKIGRFVLGRSPRDCCFLRGNGRGRGPTRTSRQLFVRVEQMLAGPEISEHKIIRPNRFRVNWVAIGFGLAAAAVLILLAQISSDRTSKQRERIAQNSPAPETMPA